MAQAGHRHLGDDVELVRAEQHRLRPREPGARHVDHDVVEIGRDKVEHAHDEVGVEGAHLGRPRRRGEHAQPARMLGQHHVEQLAVEALRLVLDLGDVEARLEIEIFGAGALLEIEVDHAGGCAAHHRVVQLERRLQRERRGADATGRRDERVDLRFRSSPRGPVLAGADAGADEVGGGQRLHQEIGDLELDQDADGRSIEFLRDDDDRRLALEPARDALQRLDLLQPGGVHVDDHRAAIGFLDLATQFRDVLFDGDQLDDLRRGEGRARVLHERLVGRDQHDLARFGVGDHDQESINCRSSTGLVGFRYVSTMTACLLARAVGGHAEVGVLDAVLPGIDHLHDGVGGNRVAGPGRHAIDALGGLAAAGQAAAAGCRKCGEDDRSSPHFSHSMWPALLFWRGRYSVQATKSVLKHRVERPDTEEVWQGNPRRCLGHRHVSRMKQRRLLGLASRGGASRGRLRNTGSPYPIPPADRGNARTSARARRQCRRTRPRRSCQPWFLRHRRGNSRRCWPDWSLRAASAVSWSDPSA